LKPGNGANPRPDESSITRVRDLPRFPFQSFSDLQQAASDKKINVGVDPLAAARWSDQFAPPRARLLINSLSVLLVGAALSAITVAFYSGMYWVLAAVPAMGISFYFSNPSSEYRKWVTVAGAASVAVFLDLLVNGLLAPALIMAYAGLTFASVRAAAFVANSSFRKALLEDEATFVQAYRLGACSLRDDKSERTYSFTSTGM
jgi:hypothetical protein